MYYSLTFIPYSDILGATHPAAPPYSLTTDRNTWDHWRIAPTSRPVFAPPSPKTNYTDIPGANGKLDLSQALTGYPLYSNRTGSIEFVVMNDFRHWQTAFTDIMSTIHNRKLFCVYEEDPAYFYVGRWAVQNWTSAESHSKVVLQYDLEPYKWRIYDSDDSWLWDPFNFSTGVIASRNSNGFNSEADVDHETYPIDGSAKKYLLNTADEAFIGSETTTSFGTGYFDRMNNVSEIIGTAPVCPLFTVQPRTGETTVNLKLEFHNPELPQNNQNSTHVITSAITDYEFADIILTNYTGVNNVTLTAQGDGVVSWVYRPGRF